LTPKPTDILQEVFDEYARDQFAFSFSGAEDVVLIDIGTKLLGSDLPVFTLDTGRLHPETYQFIEKVREHYNISIDVLSPDTETLESFVRDKGLFSFYQDGHLECCSIRKVQPLQRKLAGLAAWVTGQRRDQGASRTEIPSRQVDRAFSTPERELIKFNPLASWTSDDVWEYIRSHDVPYNPLHDQGFLSIGCAPCTRPIHEGESERAGRWWWENEDEKECGLHSQNLRPIQVIQEQDS